MLNAAPLMFTGTILNWSTSAAHLNLLVNDLKKKAQEKYKSILMYA